MVEEIYELKNKILRHVEGETSNMSRIDVKEVGELIDMVKDLAEAEKSCWEAQYYRRITEAMEQEKSGYGSAQGSSRSGYGAGTGSSATVQRQGYSMGGFHETIDPLRTAMQKANPDEREMLRKEIRSIIGMS